MFNTKWIWILIISINFLVILDSGLYVNLTQHSMDVISILFIVVIFFTLGLDVEVDKLIKKKIKEVIKNA